MEKLELPNKVKAVIFKTFLKKRNEAYKHYQAELTEIQERYNNLISFLSILFKK